MISVMVSVAFFHSNYKLTLGASSITFTGINPNKNIPPKDYCQCSGRRIEITK